MSEKSDIVYFRASDKNAPILEINKKELDKYFVPPALANILDDFLAHLEASEGDPVLITGESGVGKSLFLQTCKYYSQTKFGSKTNVVVANCAHFRPSLAESELFGHVKGAFTGANIDKKGIVEAAERGVLILEEIGDLSEPVQASILTFIETGNYIKVGSEKIEHIDILQIIGSTNKPQAMREDLRYRFFEYNIPTLGSRPLDVLYYIAFRYPQIISKLTPAGVTAIINSEWPGNVRAVYNFCKTINKYEILSSRKESTNIDGYNYDHTYYDLSSIVKGEDKINKNLFGLEVLCKELDDHDIDIEQIENFLNEFNIGIEPRIKEPIFKKFKRENLFNEYHYYDNAEQFKKHILGTLYDQYELSIADEGDEEKFIYGFGPKLEVFKANKHKINEIKNWNKEGIRGYFLKALSEFTEKHNLNILYKECEKDLKLHRKFLEIPLERADGKGDAHEIIIKKIRWVDENTNMEQKSFKNKSVYKKGSVFWAIEDILISYCLQNKIHYEESDGSLTWRILNEILLKSPCILLFSDKYGLPLQTPIYEPFDKTIIGLDLYKSLFFIPYFDPKNLMELKTKSHISNYRYPYFLANLSKDKQKSFLELWQSIFEYLSGIKLEDNEKLSISPEENVKLFKRLAAKDPNNKFLNDTSNEGVNVRKNMFSLSEKELLIEYYSKLYSEAKHNIKIVADKAGENYDSVRKKLIDLGIHKPKKTKPLAISHQ